jgi:hypothetical protein
MLCLWYHSNIFLCISTDNVGTLQAGSNLGFWSHLEKWPSCGLHSIGWVWPLPGKLYWARVSNSSAVCGIWGSDFSGCRMWWCVVGWVVCGVWRLKDFGVFILKGNHWRCWWYDPSKHQESFLWHGITSQKTWFLNSSFVLFLGIKILSMLQSCFESNAWCYGAYWWY